MCLYCTRQNMCSYCDEIIALLVQSRHNTVEQLRNKTPVSFHEDIIRLYTEVQYCLWAINVSLSVYMHLLNTVDMRTRQMMSESVSRFLSEWKSGQCEELHITLNDFIQREFRTYDIPTLPTTDHLYKENNTKLLESTVENYIGDITNRLCSVDENDMDTAINIVFPPSKNFIGRYFFPRLGIISQSLINIFKQSMHFESELDSDFDSSHSTVSSESV